MTTQLHFIIIIIIIIINRHDALRKKGIVSTKYHEMCDGKICPTGSDLQVFIFVIPSCFF